MQNPFENTEMNITDSVKKQWSAPVFEIISKEIVQSGATGAEASHSVAGS